ncbi:uncharacterized protein LOC119305408 [Triticum dicoccoides]|uniref:uncharacterized protein LOC119305408 n=1 Tax=Triticum dicoccoides TaxID=85692 RepID=UPI00188EBFF1|nr:uncharacterized protein LOC119305408 [Triticum dicoccoides]XP_044392880.1 uncharacterized protein LOC123115874 isoform X2 [Triticum aestivum]
MAVDGHHVAPGLYKMSPDNPSSPLTSTPLDPPSPLSSLPQFRTQIWCGGRFLTVVTMATVVAIASEHVYEVHHGHLHSSWARAQAGAACTLAIAIICIVYITGVCRRFSQFRSTPTLSNLVLGSTTP